MGKLKNGILGETTGKIANTVSYMLNGVNVVRTIGENNHPPTDAQLANRIRTSLTAKLLRPIKPLIAITFKSLEFTQKDYAYNAATSYQKKNATQGEYPNISIDFSKVRIAQGNLMEALNPKVEVSDKGLLFSWDIDDKLEYNRKRDQVIVLAYTSQDSAYFLPSGARRSDGQQLLELKQFSKERNFETYIAFISDDRKEISNSQYLGQIKIPAL